MENIKIYFFSAIGFLVIFMIALSFFDCERDLALENRLKQEIKEKNIKIRTIENQLEKLRLKNKDLSQEMAKISAGNLNGLVIEEKRKALIEKEALIQEREKELAEREARILELEKRLKEERQALALSNQQFIEERRKALELIGEAKQMKAIYEDLKKENEVLRQERAAAEKTANRWLIAVALFFIAIVSLIFYMVKLYYRNREKERQLRNTIAIIDDGSLSYEKRKLLSKTLDDFPEKDEED